MKKTGQTIRFENAVSISAAASIVGPREGQGPLARYFDTILEDELLGEKSWEQAESMIVKQSVQLATQKASLRHSDIDFIFAGDLLNQTIATTFGIQQFNIPFFGIFGACSTFGEGLGLGAMAIDGGFAANVLASASSHFCASEKQFRFPLELGGQRPPTASWTVTGSGSAVLRKEGAGPYVKSFTVGKIVDMGVKDVNNMGAAMVPAAVDTLTAHFKDLGIQPHDYDVIATGDLGHYGYELLTRLMLEAGCDIRANYIDCGMEIFDSETQDTHAGGSGCGCSAVTFCGWLYDRLQKGEIKKLLLVPTGALLSPTSALQGANIPGIAHAVSISAVM